MTRQALRPCAGSPVCPELVPGGGYCPDHARDRERRRGTSNVRGYDRAWQTTRALYLATLASSHPTGVAYCEHCGLTEPELEHPLEVDHIDGLGPNGPNGHDPANLQALCKPDHARKTRAQTGRP